MRVTILRIFSFFLSVILLLNLVGITLAQTSNSVSGGANGLTVNTTLSVAGVPSTVSVPNAAPVTLPAQGGNVSNQVLGLNIGIPTVLPIISTGIITDTSTGVVGASSTTAMSTSTVNDVNILNGFITADTIVSKATSTGNSASVSSSGAGSQINNLKIGTTLFAESEFQPNTQIPVTTTVTALITVGLVQVPVDIPVSGMVTLNGQIVSGNGTTTTNLQVTQLALTLSGSVNAIGIGLVSLNLNVEVALASSGVNFTAPPPNNCPVVTVQGGTNRTVQVGQSLTFGVSATDADGNTVTLTATNVPANSSFTPNPATGTPTASGTFNFTPSLAQANQTVSANFTATDNAGCGSGTAVPIIVQINIVADPPPNNCPTVTVQGGVSRTLKAGESLTFTVSATDPDGDVVTLTATNLPANASFNPNPATGAPTASGTFSFTPAAGQANQAFTPVFTATDNRGCSSQGEGAINVRSVTIIVNPPDTDDPPSSICGNHPPIISVPPLLQVGLENILKFKVIASDQDGDDVTLTADLLPPQATFDEATGIVTVTPTEQDLKMAKLGQGLLAFFTAKDKRGAVASASVHITPVRSENETKAPTLSLPASPFVIKVVDRLRFRVAALGQLDGCAVSLSTSELPSGATFDGETQTFDFTPTASQVGKAFLLTFTATDCAGRKTDCALRFIVIDADSNCVGRGTGKLDIVTKRIDFTTTTVGDRKGSMMVSLVNRGGGNLIINPAILEDNHNYRLEGLMDLPTTLQPGGVLEFRIFFEPKASGTFNSLLTISSSDPDNPTALIRLKGKATR